MRKFAIPFLIIIAAGCGSSHTVVEVPDVEPGTVEWSGEVASRRSVKSPGVGERWRGFLCYKRALEKKKEMQQPGTTDREKEILAYHIEKNLTKAQSYFKNAIDQNPTEQEGHRFLGLTYYEMTKYEEAVNCFKMALELAPLSDSTAYNLALCYGKLDNWSMAQNYACEALHINPSNRDAKQLIKLAEAKKRQESEK